MGGLKAWAAGLVRRGSGAEVATSDAGLLDHISGFIKPEQDVNGMGLFLLASNNPGENTRIAAALAKDIGDPAVTVRGYAAQNQIQVMVPAGGDRGAVRDKLQALVGRNQSKGLGALTQEQMEPLRSVTGAQARPYNDREVVEVSLDPGIPADKRTMIPTLLSGLTSQFGVDSVALDGNTVLLFTKPGVDNAKLAQNIDDAARGVRKGGRALGAGATQAIEAPKS